MRTHYQTLGISQQAIADDIKHSHRSLVKRFHPDLFPSGSEAQAEAESRMREINVAYAALSNARNRASYDETLRQQGILQGAEAGALSKMWGANPLLASGTKCRALRILRQVPPLTRALPQIAVPERGSYGREAD
jgi:DnaJ-class molecular chaperone